MLELGQITIAQHNAATCKIPIHRLVTKEEQEYMKLRYNIDVTQEHYTLSDEDEDCNDNIDFIDASNFPTEKDHKLILSSCAVHTSWTNCFQIELQCQGTTHYTLNGEQMQRDATEGDIFSHLHIITAECSVDNALLSNGNWNFTVRCKHYNTDFQGILSIKLPAMQQKPKVLRISINFFQQLPFTFTTYL